MGTIGIFIGSLRKESYSRKIAENILRLLPEQYEAALIEIGHLPFYNEDVDVGNVVPEEYTAFRKRVKQLDAVLFVTPEYNRSIPAVLKNALDVASRPRVENAWDGKPAAIISQSPGLLGGFGANHHLRQMLTVLNMPVVQQPEAYLGQVATLFDEQGNMNNEEAEQLLQALVDAFIQLIKTNRTRKITE